MSGICETCGCQVFWEVSVWVDNSGGDVCGVDGTNSLHVVEE